MQIGFAVIQLVVRPWQFEPVEQQEELRPLLCPTKTGQQNGFQFLGPAIRQNPQIDFECYYHYCYCYWHRQTLGPVLQVNFRTLYLLANQSHSAIATRMSGWPN